MRLFPLRAKGLRRLGVTTRLAKGRAASRAAISLALLAVLIVAGCGVPSDGGATAAATSAPLKAGKGGVPRDGAPLEGDPTPLPPAPTASVGTLPGTFAVSDHGDATYSIPIPIAPGRAGAVPALSLDYSSARTGESVFGVGFALGGLSMITRCPKTFAEDGVNRAVALDESDVFCLDGLRLVATKGAYGADATEYRTEPDTFVKVIGFSDPPGPTTGPIGFIAFTKEGQVLRYGFSDGNNAASLNAVGSARFLSWALSVSSDRVGNFFTVAYQNRTKTLHGREYTTELLSTTIRYSGFDPNAAQGGYPASPQVAPLRHVDFTTITLFPHTSYLRGMLFETEHRVIAIDAFGPNDELVRHLRLSYEPGDSFRNRLATVQECADGGLVCKPATRFQWSTLNPTGDSRFVPFASDSAGLSFPSNPATAVINADLNGDGLDDLVYGAPTAPDNEGIFFWEWFVAFKTPRGSALQYQPFTRAVRLKYRTDGLAIRPPRTQRAVPMDYNDDGQTDLLIESYLDTDDSGIPLEVPITFLDVLYSDGKGHLSTTPPPEPPPDDGIVELGHRPTVSPAQTFFQLADFDGDSVADLLACRDTGTGVHTWSLRLWNPARDGQAAGFGDDQGIEPLTSANTSCDLPFLTVDTDGNGAADILAAPHGTRDADGNAVNFQALEPRVAIDGGPAGVHRITSWSTYDSGLPTDPDHDQPPTDPFFAPKKEPRHRVFADINGDGLRDVVTVSTLTGQIFAAKNTGAGFEPSQFAGNGPFFTTEKLMGLAMVFDADGDGRDDILVPPQFADVPGFQRDYVLLHAEDRGFSERPSGIPFTFRHEVNVIETPSARLTTQGPRVLELDGDGNPDVIAPTHAAATILRYQNLATVTDRIIGITDGLDTHDHDPLQDPDKRIEEPNIVITYDALFPSTVDGHDDFPSDPHLSTYLPGSACAYPVHCAVGPKRVVTGYALQTGATDDRTGSSLKRFAFQYRDGRFDRLGRGWLGFSRRIAWEGMGTGAGWVARSVLEYDNTTYDPTLRRYPFAGSLLRVTRAEGAGAARSYASSSTCDVALTDTHYATHASAGGASYFVFADSIRERRATTDPRPCSTLFGELGTSEPGVGRRGDGFLMVTDTRHDTTADDFGNATAVTTTFLDGGTKSATHAFSYDEAQWFVAQETKSTECGQEAGQPQACRSTLYTDYDAHGLLTHAIVEPGDTFLRLDVTIGRHPTFGIANAIGAVDARTNETRTTVTILDDEGIFPTASINPAGHVTRRTFDAARGTTRTITDPNGLVTQMAFDGFGRLGTVVRPDGTRTDVTWSRRNAAGAGAPPLFFVGVHMTTTNGEERDVSCDARGRPSRVVSSAFAGAATPSGKQLEQRLIYDPWTGAVAKRSIPAPVGTDPFAFVFEALEMDGRGRPTRAIAADGATTTYDVFGLRTQITDASGHVRSVTLDSHGRVAIAGEGPNDAQKMTYAYDSLDALRQTTDPAGNVTTYVNDVHGQPITVTDPDRGRTFRNYDAFDQQRFEFEANGNFIQLDYDALGRPKLRSAFNSSHLNEAETTTWTWDTAPGAGIGKLAEVASERGAVRSYAYDALGRVAVMGQEVDHQGLFTSYEYDAKTGRLARLVYPDHVNPGPCPPGLDPCVVNPGPAVRFDYDQHGYLARVFDDVDSTLLWEAIGSDDAGRLNSEQFAGGETTTGRTFDPRTGRLNAISTVANGISGPIQNLSYDYFANGDLHHRTDTRQGLTEEFAYDDFDRLTTVTLNPAGNVTASHTYDALGNITTKTGVGTYSYDPAHPHEVTSIARTTGGVDTFAYDASGDQTDRPDATVEYTTFHLPRTIRSKGRPGPKETLFTYDGEGARVKKDGPSGATLYVGGLHERVTTANGTDYRYYVPGPGRVVALLTFHEAAKKTDPSGWTKAFIHPDLHGSLDALTDEHGNVLERHSYDAYGQPRNPAWNNTTPPPAAPSTSTLGFTGQEDEPELGLVNMQGRVYDPRIGRFLTADPHVSPGRAVGWNPYAYANDSPLRFVDPSGFDGEDTDGAPPGADPGVGATGTGPGYTDGMTGLPVVCDGSRCSEPGKPLAPEAKAAEAPQSNPTTTATQGAKEAGGTKPDTGGDPTTNQKAPVAVTADDSSGARYVTRGGAAPIATSLSVVESLQGGARNAAIEAIEHTVDSIRPRGPLVWMLPATLQSRFRPISLDALKVAAPQGGADREWYDAGHTFATVGEVALTVIAPAMLGGGTAAVAAEELSLSTSNALAGVERASPALLDAVAARRNVQIVAEGSEELRYLDAIGAEANVGGPAMDNILLRPNPSKAAVLEEFLHGTQNRLGIIERLGQRGAEYHVKSFMIRHARMLGLGAEDVARLRTLMDLGL